jgi:hypothetical protein
MKHFITFLIISFIGVSAALHSVPAEAAVIRVTQPKIELELAPGEVYSGESEVENPTEEELELTIYLEDWEYKNNGSGEKNFGPPGTMKYSASKWITYAPASSKLKPFSKQVVRYTVTVPPDASGGYYSVLFFENTIGSMPDPNQEGASIRVAGRVGAIFMIRVKGTVMRTGEIAAVKITPPAGNAPMEIETTFQNTGNVDIALGGNLLIMDAEGRVVGRGDLNKIYTLPGSLDTRTSQWVGRLAKGSYDLLLTYDMGQGQAIVKEEKIVIS